MGITTENIRNIIASAHPNQNLIDKAWEKYDVATQRQKEQALYDKITMVDPITHNPIKSIEDLNNLILHLDQVYKLGALLPVNIENGGEVERILSRKYNLKLRAKNKFSTTEQVRIQAELERIANLALIDLKNDPEFGFNITEATINDVLWPLLAQMSKYTESNGIITIFMSGEWQKDRRVKSIYEDLLKGKNLEIVRVRIAEKVLGSKRTKEGKKANSKTGLDIFQVINSNTSGSDKRVKEIKVNPKLNELPEAAFRNLYEFARSLKLLDENLELDAQNKLGQGTLSPMDPTVTPEIWRNDVMAAIKEALSTGELKNLIPDTDFDTILNNLLDKYDVANQIALGRSLNTLRGFTGELRGILMMHILFPKGDNTLLGKAKIFVEHGTKPEDAPIDIMVQLLDLAFGIQVKNISDMAEYSWGNFRDRDGMLVPNFYIERLQTTLDSSEADFFGAFSYNKPVGRPTDPNPYRDIYSGFEEHFNTVFVPIYQQLALYIIRQTTKIKGSNNSLLNGTIKNDFFLMANKIIPASAFLQSVTNNDDLITSSFTINSPTMGHYSSSAKQPSSYIPYTNETYIHYEVHVNFKQLLQSAYSP